MQNKCVISRGEFGTGNPEYFSGFHIERNVWKPLWVKDSPLLLNEDELDVCVRDIKESYDGKLFVTVVQQCEVTIIAGV